MTPIDHVAVPSNDVRKSVEWYAGRFGAEVIYEDKTWAFLKMGEVKLAIVSPQQHPPHVAVRVDEQQLHDAAREHGVEIDKHRDGTAGIYLKDPYGNAVELICYPAGKTIYANPGQRVEHEHEGKDR